MHLAPLIRDLAVILAVAGLVSMLFQRIRQPVVLGYIIAGIIIGPFTPPYTLVTDVPSIKIWAELGVIFLMFSLGLEFSFRKLAAVGVSAGFTACFEVSFMLIFGFITGQLFGWSKIDSLFLAAMCSISSTTIIVKALNELNLKTRRFSELIFGVLIVEDLVAILLLVILSTIAINKSISGLAILSATGKLGLVIGSWFITGYFVVPRFVRYVGRSGTNEILTIVSIGLCLSLVVLAAKFQYSVALGAFIMGSILAESTESHRIEVRLESLRDLFAAIFFVSVGMLIDPRVLWNQFGVVIAISMVVMLGKIISVTLGALITGQTLRTAIQVGFGLGQIGEFSFIIAGLGLSLKVTNEFLSPVAVAVSLITTFTTPYFIKYSHRFAVALENKLPMRITSALAQYSAWTQERRADSARKKEFYRLLLKWGINGILVTTIFILSAELLLPLLKPLDGKNGAMQILGWVIAVAIASPFIWGMLTTFKDFRMARDVPAGDQPPQGGTLFLMRLLSLLLVGALSLEFFTLRYAIILLGALMSLLFILFRQQLGASYHWFERRFLSTFEPKVKSKDRMDILRHLAPWDAHLVRIKIHPNADIVQKSIAQARLRSDFGLNVVAIQRGLKTIVAPQPHEVLLPKDELLVLGTDEQVEIIRPKIEKPPGLDERFKHISGYELRQLRLHAHSPFQNRTIRELGIRETFGTMVVGLERAGQRMINPESDLRLNAGDILWIVGEKMSLDRMFETMTPSEASSV